MNRCLVATTATFLLLFLAVTMVIINEDLLIIPVPKVQSFFTSNYHMPFINPRLKVDPSFYKNSLYANSCPWNRSIPPVEVDKSKPKKQILMYTTLFGAPRWGDGVKDSEDFLTELGCPVDHCRVTYDKSKIPEASAVVFHARDMPSPNSLWDVSKRSRPSWQRWAYHISESPINTPDPSPLAGLFNLTMTYQLDSDVFIPYRRFRLLKPGEERPPKDTNYAKGKTKMATWLVSNCGVPFREKVVRSLEDHGVQVDVGGGCSPRWPHRLDCAKRDCKGLEEHRFYLAFENGFCRDYVTGKYWYHPIDYNMIPIVLGGSEYENPCLVPPNSYINVQDFSSIKDLADHLKAVASNDALFNSYFAWKQKYYVYPASALYNWPHGGIFLCELCHISHDKNYPIKVYDSLTKFRSVQRDCSNRDTRFRTMQV